MTKTDRVPYGIAPWETGGVSASPDLGSNQTTQASVALPIDALPRGDKHILVVEDDPRVRSGVLEQLRSLGYEATGAGDGTAGLAAFEAAPSPFDLLLTDVIVPGPMNGKTLADEVRRRWPDTKLVFMSGYSENILSTPAASSRACCCSTSRSARTNSQRCCARGC